MSAAPRNKAQDSPLSTQVTRFGVYVRDDSDPMTGSDESPDYRFAELSLGSGAGRLDTAQFEIVQRDKGLSDAHTPTEFSRKVEIRTPPRTKDEKDAGVPDTTIFRGEFGICSVQYSETGTERLNARARVEQWYFGTPIVGYTVAKYVDPDYLYRTMHDDVVFNPEIDELVEGNRSDHYVEITTDPVSTATDVLKRYVWIDPESVRSQSAETANGQYSSNWTLAQAVMSLCWLCNSSEEYIKNPDYAALNATCDGAPAVLNVSIPRGLYLPSALDLLLNPLGFLWRVDYVQMSDDADPPVYTTEMRIVVYKRGEGPEKNVTMQAWGANKDVKKTNVRMADIEWNVADTANIVTVFGAHLEVEATFELKRSWLEEDDALTADQLRKGEPIEGEADTTSQYDSRPHVWRKWVLNEGGDYTGSRTVVKPITATFDINTIQDDDNGTTVYPLGQNNVAKNRKFWPPLTKDPDGRRQDFLVEYLQPAEYGGTDEWINVLTLENGHFEVLERECGILFTGITPPREIVDLGENARVRITACIRGDQRVSYTTAQATESPNGNDIAMVVNAETQFFKRRRIDYVDEYSENWSRFTEVEFLPTTPAADERDDTTAMTTYANNLRDNESAARLSASITLEGFRPEYKRGDIITKIEGREISFDQNSKTALSRRYLQVTGITYTPTETVLELETFETVAGRSR
jgi:hypothetical protein